MVPQRFPSSFLLFDSWLLMVPGNKELHFMIVLNDLSNLERRGRCVDISYSVQGVHASRESRREIKSGEDDDGSRIADVSLLPYLRRAFTL